jgi:hypothetical protein
MIQHELRQAAHEALAAQQQLGGKAEVAVAQAFNPRGDVVGAGGTTADCDCSPAIRGGCNPCAPQSANASRLPRFP